jgi:hypothetical protein
MSLLIQFFIYASGAVISLCKVIIYYFIVQSPDIYPITPAIMQFLSVRTIGLYFAISENLSVINISNKECPVAAVFMNF